MPGGGTEPGSGGDPYVIQFDGTQYYFDGLPGLNRLYEGGDIKIHPRIQALEGGQSYYSGVDLQIGDVKIVVYDGFTHVIHGGFHWEVQNKYCTLDAPGHFGNTSDQPHPLQGVPHCNVWFRSAPENRPLQESGYMIDGPTANDDPGRYIVPEEGGQE